MNARLRMRLLQRAPRQAPPPLRLLGDGFDAIIRRTTRRGNLLERLLLLDGEPLSQHDVTPERRLARYVRARHAQPPGRLDDLRRLIGNGFRNAWRSGQFPAMFAQMPRPQRGVRSVR